MPRHPPFFLFPLSAPSRLSLIADETFSSVLSFHHFQTVAAAFGPYSAVRQRLFDYFHPHRSSCSQMKQNTSTRFLPYVYGTS